MKPFISKFLQGKKYEDEIEGVLIQVEKVLKSWEPICTYFISPPTKEALIKIFENVSDITYVSDGGYPNAERQRIFLQRKEYKDSIANQSLPLSAIQIEGNFLFDRTRIIDFRKSINENGVPFQEIGDIFLCGDRGAQAICTPKAAKLLHNQVAEIRSVGIQFKQISINELRLPPTRNPKRLFTVEASKRLDAISSAGFGLSRAKVLDQIKDGKLRLNWEPISKASHSVEIGDKIQLEGKGSIEVLNFEITKRSRWRFELLKK